MTNPAEHGDRTVQYLKQAEYNHVASHGQNHYGNMHNGFVRSPRGHNDI